MNNSIKSVVDILTVVVEYLLSYITYVCKYLALSLATLNLINLLLLTYIRISFCCALTIRKAFIILVNIMQLIGVQRHRIAYTGIALFYGLQYIVWNSVHSFMLKRLYIIKGLQWLTGVSIISTFELKMVLSAFRW